MTRHVQALAVWIIYLFGRQTLPPLWRWLREGHHFPDAMCVLLGVAVNYIALQGDSEWWFWAWFADLFGLDSRDWWFLNGVYSNIVFRQFVNLVGATLHLIPEIRGRRYAFNLYWGIFGTAIAFWFLLRLAYKASLI